MSRAALMAKMMTEHQKRFGADTCYTVPEHGNTHYGVPLGSLALEYLLGSTILPLERIIELSGPFGSGKSALGYELLRMLTGHGGIGSVVETENKSSLTLMQSILKELAEMVRFHRTKLMDQAQDRITAELMVYQKLVPDRSVPMGILLDSLVGNRAEETVEKIDKEGHADRAHAKEAMMIAAYFSSLSDKLIGQPIVFLFTNHEKERIAQGPTAHGPSIRNPGGVAPDFFATYHIRAVKAETFHSALDPGFTIRLTTKKSSMGADRRSILVDMRWHYREVDGILVQDTYFDWPKATATLLDSEDVPKSVLNDIVQVKKVTGSKFNCAALGLKEAPPEEVGKAIHASTELMQKLRAALGIFTWRQIAVAEDKPEKPAKAKKAEKED